MFRRKTLSMVFILMLFSSIGFCLEELSIQEMKEIKGQQCRMCWTDGDNCETSEPPGWPPLFNPCTVCPVRPGEKSCQYSSDGPGCYEWTANCGPGISGYSLEDDKSPTGYECVGLGEDYECGGRLMQCNDY